MLRFTQELNVVKTTGLEMSSGYNFISALVTASQVCTIGVNVKFAVSNILCV